MKTQVTFRHLKSHPDLQEAAIEEAKKFEKYYDGITSANIEFSEENGTDKIVEFIVHVNGSTLVAKERADEFPKSLNDASDKIIRQLKKWKTKMNHTQA